eukprot:TRINITY_DN540_c0_g1_i2.p1 TRINITY_DN540_c0_g1~~TRINITY_DN540_c0_g1_i2.p1  ORF type:complete len:351 (-),score=105.33 TRINITY_DN540_c0_g1_i2:23-1075(-)
MDNSAEEVKQTETTPVAPTESFEEMISKKLTPKQLEMWKRELALSDEERRARYRRSKFAIVENMPTWKEYSDSFEYLPESKYGVNDEINSKISLFHGDITTIECDAIVNAANERCLGGGGVDGSIHNAAGNDLYRECKTLNGCRTGKTKITRGYNLPARYVLHSVGPIGESPRELTSCYWTALELAAEYNLKTVVFCGISTGIFGYPLEPASRIALKTTRLWLEQNHQKIDRVVFCTFLDKERVCYERLIGEYFPVPKREEEKEQPKIESLEEEQKTVEDKLEKLDINSEPQQETPENPNPLVEAETTVEKVPETSEEKQVEIVPSEETKLEDANPPGRNDDKQVEEHKE